MINNRLLNIYCDTEARTCLRGSDGVGALPSGRHTMAAKCRLEMIDWAIKAELCCVLVCRY